MVVWGLVRPLPLLWKLSVVTTFVNWFVSHFFLEPLVGANSGVQIRFSLGRQNYNTWLVTGFKTEPGGASEDLAQDAAVAALEGAILIRPVCRGLFADFQWTSTGALFPSNTTSSISNTNSSI